MILVMRPIKYYSKLDEEMLWNGLSDQAYICNLRMIDAGLQFEVFVDQLDWESFKNLVSIFFRYRVSVKELKKIELQPEVNNWFTSVERDWHSQLKSE